MGYLTSSIDKKFNIELLENYKDEGLYADIVCESIDFMSSLTESIYMIDMLEIETRKIVIESQGEEAEKKEEKLRDKAKIIATSTFDKVAEFLERHAKNIASAIQGYIEKLQDYIKKLNDPVGKLVKAKPDMIVFIPGNLYNFADVKVETGIDRLSEIVKKVLGTQDLANLAGKTKEEKERRIKAANENKFLVAKEVSKALGLDAGGETPKGYTEFLKEKYLKGETKTEKHSVKELYDKMKVADSTIAKLKSRQKALNSDLRAEAAKIRKMEGDAEVLVLARLHVQGLTTAVNLALADANAHKDACVQFLNAVKKSVKETVSGQNKSEN